MHAWTRRLIALLRAAVLLSIAFPSLTLAAQFKVTRVYDGDTVRAVGHDIEIQVRLVGIDAPETGGRKREPGQPFSIQARKHLASLVLNKEVDVKGYGLDRYNRVLGVILQDGRNVNLEMVRAGFTEVYRGKLPHGFDLEPYLKAESEAKREGRGMWTQGARYVSPKEWRRARTE